jgi:hypothetical protein
MPHLPTRPRTLVLSAAAGCLAACLACSSGLPAQASHSHPTPTPTGGVLTSSGQVGGCPVFPANNYWNTPVTDLQVDSHSDAWLSHMSPSSLLHPDFGKSYGEQPVPYGIPITVVDASHAKVDVHFQYRQESDPGPYPLGDDTRIEGGAHSKGDRHALVVDSSTCELYETWRTQNRSGSWYAGSGATWDLRSNKLRRDGWTSADAAGLPIISGLLRYDEVEQAGLVTHAIRFTTDQTQTEHIWPARHDAGSTSSVDYPPMGARFRLKASFPTSGYRADTVAVLDAMKTYGLVLADNGSPWYFQGTEDKRWPGALLDELKTIPANAFEAVDTAPMMIHPNSGAAH